MRPYFILFILSLFISCAKSPEEKVDSAIDVALTRLSSGKCDEAFKVLNEAGHQPDNAIYLQVYASAYGCKANYSYAVIVDALEDGAIDTSASGLLKSLSILSTSIVEHEADSTSYQNMRSGLNVLLNDDGVVQPSQVKRNAKFGNRKSGDLGMQILFMGIAQFGKFLNFYGNVDSAGNKGTGAANVDEQGNPVSTCFVDYTGDASAYINLGTNPGGACRSGNRVSHPNLSTAAANLVITKRRMCEGLTVFTNIIDVISNITLSSNSSFAELEQLKELVQDYKEQATTVDPSLQVLMDTTSQKECERIVTTAAEFEKLQKIFALIFETGLQ